MSRRKKEKQTGSLPSHRSHSTEGRPSIFSSRIVVCKALVRTGLVLNTNLIKNRDCVFLQQTVLSAYYVLAPGQDNRKKTSKGSSLIFLCRPDSGWGCANIGKCLLNPWHSLIVHDVLPMPVTILI